MFGHTNPITSTLARRVWRAWHRRQYRSEVQLSRISDRLLRDIGVTRADIDHLGN